MGGLASALRLWHTVRHLRWEQARGQVALRLRRSFDGIAPPDGAPVPPFPGVRWRPGEFLPPGGDRPAREDLLRGEFVFLNERRALGWPPDWRAPGAPRLWQYNLQYFEWLWPLGYAEARRAMLDWAGRQSPAAGGPVATAWEPYPVSLRTQNLCAYFFGRHAAEVAGDAELRDTLWRAIFLGMRWLAKHLERHLLGNHLFENAVALAMAGACFAGAEADSWLRQGRAILQREIAEQVLSDGTHFERSPMYHSRVLYTLLALRQTGEPSLRALVDEPIGRMATALGRLCHTDGRIALLNDSAFGIYNAPIELLAASSAFDTVTGAWALPGAGYYGWRGTEGHYVVCDAGAIGPDYIPGHAHGDIFSFELSLGGHRVVVDAGVHDYEAGERRRYCRSTRAHNTVEIDGADQCEFWGAFRVARRGRPRDVVWQPSETGFILEGWHDGYERLSGAPRHARRFEWRQPGHLLVTDRVTAARPVRAVSRLRLHPACRVEKMSQDRAVVAYAGGRFEVRFRGEGCPAVEESHYFPEFGVAQSCVALAFAASGREAEFGFEIRPLV